MISIASSVAAIRKARSESGWIETVVPQRQLDFGHEEPYAKTLGPRR